jgi:hypothetical protein
MVTIEQGMKIDNTSYKSILKQEDVNIKVNSSMVEKDISRLNDMKSATNNIYDIVNIKRVLEALNGVYEWISADNEIDIKWVLKNGRLETDPINIKNIEEYNIDINNYIEVEDDTEVIEVDTSDVLKMIAFEMMYRDIGEDNKSIEELLSKCSILGVNKDNPLIEYINNEHKEILRLTDVLRIDQSPYCCGNGKIRNYYCTKVYKSDGYREVTRDNNYITNVIIANEILAQSNKNKIGIKLVSISNRKIIFIIRDEDKEVIMKTIPDKVNLRVFGRIFRVGLKINLY